MKRTIILALAFMLSASSSLHAISVDHKHGVVEHAHRISKETLIAATLCSGSVLCIALALRIIYTMVKDKKNRTHLAKITASGSLIAAAALIYAAKQGALSQ